MPQFFTDSLLHRLRNEIPMQTVFRQLNWPHKRRGDQWAFLCPACGEYHSSVHPRTNLGRCFPCQTNFNPIDFVMGARSIGFVEAVAWLKPLLPASRPPQTPGDPPASAHPSHSPTGRAETHRYPREPSPPTNPSPRRPF